MNKVTKTVLAAGLALAVATPALAEFKATGFYQVQGINQGLKNDVNKDGDSNQFVDQRLRARLVYGLNDNVAIVYQAEIDTVWGAADKNNYYDSKNAGTDGYSATGGGGKFDTDGVNIETKNLYLDLKSGDAAAQIGLFNRSDEFQGIIQGASDMAGVNATYKMGDTALGLLYSKWDEDTGTGDNGTYGNSDDTDFYGVTVGQKINDAFKVGAAVYYLDDNDAANKISGYAAVDETDKTDRETFYYGVTADATFGDFGVDGFVLFQDGKYNVDSTTLKDVDTSAYAVTAKAKMKIENGDLGFRVLYISEDDDKTDENGWYGNFSEYDFVNENQMIFLTDKFVANATKERYAMKDAANAGFGLMAFMLSGNHKLPMEMTLNWGAGYYLSVDDERNNPVAAKPANGAQIIGTSDYRRGDTLGYELCVRLTKKYFEKVEVSLNAAYADFGDFYDDTVLEGTKVSDPDAIYKAYLMARVPF